MKTDINTKMAYYKIKIDKIHEELLDMHEYARELIKENEDLKSEHYKDDEIAKLNERIKKLEKERRFSYMISEEQHDDITNFIREHRKNCSGSTHVEFHDFAVVSIGVVKCEKCGLEHKFLEV